MNRLTRIAGVIAIGLAASSHSHLGARQGLSPQPPTLPGQSATQLSDGRWLLLGGTDSLQKALIWEPVAGVVEQIGPPHTPRAWHTATLLADGSVLVLGGVDESGQTLAEPERFTPLTRQFTPVDVSGITRRAHHTATLLTDGRVLVVGGDVEAGGVSAELWDPSAQALPVPGPAAEGRRGHRAHLLADGRVLISGGMDAAGNPISVDEVFEAGGDVFLPGYPVEPQPSTAHLNGSSPADGAVDVPSDARVALRFETPLDVLSVRGAAVSLHGPNGEIERSVIPAEGGRLIFITPAQPLQPGASFTLTADGLRASTGERVELVRLTFAVTPGERTLATPVPSDPEVWKPAGKRWRTDGAETPWQRLAPLSAPKGVTALAGQVLQLDGRPLANVTLEIEGRSVRSDRSGRFLLTLGSLPGGRHELIIEGKTANRAGRRFGRFEYGLSIVKGRTNVLPFTIWMPVLDTANAVRIDSPTRVETVITTPHIPGLELHLPAGTVITDEDGKIVRDISITPVPVDRPPFPLPNGVQVPIYFTIQPGGAYVSVGGGSGSYRRGAWLVYPNYAGRPAGERLPFWQYDPEKNGWHVYGQGTVTPDGQQVRPDRGVYLYEFTGAMLGVERDPPSDPPGGGETELDPVDLVTGLFISEKVDLFLPDVLPLALKRTYRNNDDGVRPFGVGTQHPYDLWFDNQNVFQEFDLILPDATRIHYVRTSPGIGPSGAVFEHKTTPTEFNGSTVVYNGAGWDLTLKNGMTYVFGVEAPLQLIRDRFGNTITVTRTGGANGNIARLTSPHGRYIEFTYDTSNRITQAQDNLGRTVTYTYDTAGRLSTVTDAKGGVTEYTYDGSHRMLTIEDARGIVYLENEYDTAGRVIRQTMADGGISELDYTINGSGETTQTDVTNARGFVRRVTFNSARYMTSSTYALGEAEEQTTTYTRDAGSQLIETVTDPLGRVTRLQYDANNNPTNVTRLYGTAGATTTAFTYDAQYHLVTSVTDPLNHTTSAAFDALGRPLSVTDALGHTATFATNAAGQMLSATNALGHQTTLGYDVGDLVVVQSPLGHSRQQFVDVAGRVTKTVDSHGLATLVEYDALNQVTKTTGPLGGETTFTYDGNGNVLTLTDARGKTTTWTYNNMDRVATRTDPLSRTESFTYDLNGNPISWTDRKGQVTTYTYDALDRTTFIGYGTSGSPPSYESTVTTTYDAGNRATQLVDSGAGTITRTYDLLDGLTQEVTPEGTVSYTYDAAGRRSTMTVTGQTSVSYTYDHADRLTAITQGTATVTSTYDIANRRTALTLPNGIVVESVYDGDSQLSGLTYKLGGIAIGDLAYTYDANGQRVAVSGTYARSGLPAALTSATYDDANQIAAWGGTSFTYDANGNLTSDVGKAYTWNARNELTAISGSVSASFGYDGVGRRRVRTVAGAPTQYLHDGLSPVQELASGTPTAHLLTGLGIDEYFTRTDSAGTRNMLTDALGSSIALTDGSGMVQTEYTYEPFGAVTTSGQTSGNSFGFTGREADSTGLNYYRARYYDARLQRFIAEDPLMFQGGDVNLSAYASNDPISRVDPLGLSWSTNWTFFWDWFLGRGPRQRSYGQTEQETVELASSLGVDALRKAFEKGGCVSIDTGSYGTIQAYIDTVLDPRSNDWSSTSAQVGGFGRARIVNNGNGMATFTIRNVAGANSFFLHAVPNRRATEGMMTNIVQSFSWTEAVPCVPGRK